MTSVVVFHSNTPSFRSGSLPSLTLFATRPLPPPRSPLPGFFASARGAPVDVAVVGALRYSPPLHTSVGFAAERHAPVRGRAARGGARVRRSGRADGRRAAAGDVLGRRRDSGHGFAGTGQANRHAVRTPRRAPASPLTRPPPCARRPASASRSSRARWR